MSLYIILPLDSTILHGYNQRRNILGLSDQTQKDKIPHITLFDIRVNMNHPLATTIFDPKSNTKLYEILARAYKNVFFGHKIVSRIGNYEILGKDKFYCKKYELDDAMLITTFRMMFYSYIEEIAGSKKTVSDYIDPNDPNDPNGKLYKRYFYGNIPQGSNNSRHSQDNVLFDVPSHHHGKSVWTAHISLCTQGELDNINSEITTEDELVNKLLEKYSVNINNISFRDHLGVPFVSTKYNGKRTNMNLDMNI